MGISSDMGVIALVLAGVFAYVAFLLWTPKKVLSEKPNRFFVFHFFIRHFPSWLCFGRHFIHVAWLYSLLYYGFDMWHSSLCLYNQNPSV